MVHGSLLQQGGFLHLMNRKSGFLLEVALHIWLCQVCSVSLQAVCLKIQLSALREQRVEGSAGVLADDCPPQNQHWAGFDTFC